jgi:predicted nucleic-acid-binding protein
MVGDDPEQAAQARRLLEEASEERESCFVSDPVLCELEWVLASRYRARRADVAAAIRALLENGIFAFEDRKALLQAVESYQRSHADLADHLIGAQAQARGAATTWTFDRALRNCAGFSILG